MNKTWKNVATIGVIALVSIVVSATTVKVMNQNESPESSITRLGALSSRDASFANTAQAISPREIGSAPDLTVAAERSVRAVVHIKVEGEREAQMGGIDPFEFFFGQGQSPQRRMQPVVGYGSGVIISSDGYIMTNNHVIDGSKAISVTLEDNRTFTAKLIGTDPNTDIALIKIDVNNLPTLPFGDSDKLRLGEWVLAVGNPFNLTNTVTAGIISAKGRTTSKMMAGGIKAEYYIQTDAAVNSGNSGGALVNAQGGLIGINTMILSPTGNYSGYSFAVPINIAAKVVEDIKRFGTVQRALLGIEGRDVDSELVKKEGLKTNEGVYVGGFSEISAALAAGIEVGDVITSINGNSVKDFGQLINEVGRYRPGDKVEVKVNRQGSIKTFRVTLKNKDGGKGIVKEDSGIVSKLGASLKALTSDQLRAYGLSYGVEVERVGSGLLRDAGVEDGYIILTANDTPIRSVSDLAKVLSKSPQSSSRFRLGASSNTIYLRGFYPQMGEVVGYTIRIK